MKKSLTIGLAAAAGLLATLAAYAGNKAWLNVMIWDGYAAGTVGYARNSTDNSIESIGCYTWGNNTTADSGAGGCQATNAQGLSRSCVTNNASLLATMRAVNGDSYLSFNWDANGYCTFVWVSNNSAYEPKVK